MSGKARLHTHIFIYLSLRAKQVHKSDHSGWNVGQIDFSLKCIFKNTIGERLAHNYLFGLRATTVNGQRSWACVW